MTGVWSSYREASINSNVNCVVGRDARSNTRDSQLSESITYDGKRWRYQDYGLRHFDECFLLASNAGASIITPYTIGRTGDNYWVHSVHMCNTYEWITNNGARIFLRQHGALINVQAAAAAEHGSSDELSDF